MSEPDIVWALRDQAAIYNETLCGDVCRGAADEIERLHGLLVERDGDYLSYGQLRERLVESESRVAQQQVEIDRLQAKLTEAQQAACILSHNSKADRDIREMRLHFESRSALSGHIEKDVKVGDDSIPMVWDCDMVQGFLNDDDIQEIIFVSANIGFWKRLTKIREVSDE